MFIEITFFEMAIKTYAAETMNDIVAHVNLHYKLP